MRNNLIIRTLSLFGFLFWGGCQSLQKPVNPVFESFEIRKLTSLGIESVIVESTMGDWPVVRHLPAKPNPISGQKIRLAVVGDTGCRLKESGGKNSYQKCNVAREWPYPEVARAMATENFDFGIHTGDFHYREQCSDPKLCAVYAKHVGYGWAAWWDDFYAPSLELFKKTPWLFVRGNHEDCQRAYQGWGALSPVNKNFSESCEPVEPYQWIEIDDLVLINFDNSSFEDRALLSEAEKKKWSQKFSEIANRIATLKDKKEIWFVTHKPILGFFPDKDDAEPIKISENMASVLKEGGLYSKIDYFLSGHIHSQQLVPAGEKVQLIVGHGGAGLDSFGRKITTPRLVSTTENAFSFGYGIFQRQGFKKWSLIFKNTKGELQQTCQLNREKVLCD